MTPATVNPEQITALFDERQRFESWLNTLETRRSATPTHIFEKVHADYSARLHQVVEQLASHRAVLQEMERTLLDKLSMLDADEGKHRDEAAESELRAAVGELKPDQHRDIATRTSAALDAIQRERTSLTDELSRLRAVLVAAGAAPQPAQAPVEAAAPSAPPRRSGAATATPTPPAAAPRSGDWARTAAPVAPPDRSSGGSRAHTPDGGGAFDDLEFLKSMSETHTSGESVAVGSASDAQSQSAAGAGAHPTPARPRSTGQTAVRTTPAAQGAEQVKTLKCQECGTLNYPTEWYCERCGAELATL